MKHSKPQPKDLFLRSWGGGGRGGGGDCEGKLNDNYNDARDACGDDSNSYEEDNVV